MTRFRKYVDDRGIRIAHIARKTNVTPTTVQKWLKDPERIRLRYAKELCFILNITLDELIEICLD